MDPGASPVRDERGRSRTPPRRGPVLLLTVALTTIGASGRLEAGAEPAYWLGTASRERVVGAIARGTEWILRHQQEDGSFRAPSERSVPPVALTSMVLWALTEAIPPGSKEKELELERAARYLLSHQHADGGIYQAERGLSRYTSLVARQALRAWKSRTSTRGIDGALERLDLFVYRNRAVESIVDEERRPSPGVQLARIRRLESGEDLPENVDRALAFLVKARRKPTDRPPHGRATDAPARSGTVGYDDLLRYIGELTRRDNPTVSRAYVAIRHHYDVRENPDLTQRYGPDGFGPHGDAGLYYYYLTLARTLASVGRPMLETMDGKKHDWSRELSDRLLGLQRDDGSWINENARWWEDDGVLVTSYALLALGQCRDLREANR